MNIHESLSNNYPHLIEIITPFNWKKGEMENDLLGRWLGIHLSSHFNSFSIQGMIIWYPFYGIFTSAASVFATF